MLLCLYTLTPFLLFGETNLQVLPNVPLLPGLAQRTILPRSFDYTFYRCQQCYHKPAQSYPGWTDGSVISCGIKTLRLYPDSFSFSYNPISNVCTPGLNTEAAQTWANEVFNMVVCDPSKGLQLFTSGRSMSCLGWFKSYVTYFEADDACRSKGGYLMTPKTMDKVAMLLPLVTERAWIGLDDTIQEGVYLWKDDNLTLTDDVKGVIFASGEPNNNGDLEDCNVYTSTLLKDVPCWFNYTYLCEIFTINL